jgi:hypothetical protein
MLRKRSARVAFAGIVAAIGLTAMACAPAPTPGAPPNPIDWSFKATSMTVNSSQDAVYDPIFHACISFTGCSDEPYILQVAFRVRIGQPGSASAFVVKSSTLPSTSAGQTRTLTGGQQGTVTFTGIQPLDVLDALNSNNKMDVVGTYTWAADEDAIDSLTTGANAIADIFKTALNNTLAAGTLPNGDTNALVQLILNALFNNIGNPFSLIASNIPCLGLCDDVLGGSIHIGIGATGTLASLIDTALASTTIPNVAIPLVDVPPDIQGGSIYTMGGTKTATQVYTGAGGQHTWNYVSGPA